jgi:hypothetical protein
MNDEIKVSILFKNNIYTPNPLIFRTNKNSTIRSIRETYNISSLIQLNYIGKKINDSDTLNSINYDEDIYISGVELPSLNTDFGGLSIMNPDKMKPEPTAFSGLSIMNPDKMKPEPTAFGGLSIMNPDKMKSETLFTTLPQIIIDGTTFTLLKKANINSYQGIVITSNYQGVQNTFNLYRSNSELGLWRFCTDFYGIKYKGDDNRFQKDSHFIYDYIQTTLIHLELQKFINENYDNLEKSSINVRCIQVISDPEIKEMIDSQDRVINEQPFAKYQKGADAVVCGDNSEMHFEYIRRFTNELEQLYTFKYETNTSIIPRYEFDFQEIIHISGEIFSVELERKIPIISQTNTIVLYYMISSLTQISIHGETELVRKKLAESMNTNIANICKKNMHFMPFFLTNTEARCNNFGLYTKYIPCGAFICKLFDYSSKQNKQCSVAEIKAGRCTLSYTYIGNRYDNVFPFKNISTILMNNAKCETEVFEIDDAYKNRQPDEVQFEFDDIKGGAKRNRKTRKNKVRKTKKYGYRNKINKTKSKKRMH